MNAQLRTSRLLVASFAAAILVGTFLLLMPFTWAHRAEPVGFVDALFTATSAICVTGLTTFDIGTRLNLLGQMILLVLIQIGGIGILTFSNLTLSSVGRRIGLHQRTLITESHGALPHLDPRSLVRQVFIYTLSIELLGAFLLSVRFALDFPPHVALWMGLFHSVSAFCNAGFSPFPDSLVRYSGDLFVNAVVMGLIITGGLGFVVFADLRHAVHQWWLGKRTRLSLHTRVVVRTTVWLIVAGTVLVALLELGNGATGVGVVHHVTDSLFLSVTARTAGFNMVDMASLTNPTLLVIILLMLVGGSPGSTAGGFKTTSGAAIWALIVSKIRNRPRAELLDRSIPVDVQAKAITNFAGFLALSLLGTVLLQAIEYGGQAHRTVGTSFIDHAFEAVSALCTVGLSVGVTPTLSAPSKLVLVMLMFLGRVGPVLVGLSLVGLRRRVDYTLPEETMSVS